MTCRPAGPLVVLYPMGRVFSSKKCRKAKRSGIFYICFFSKKPFLPDFVQCILDICREFPQEGDPIIAKPAVSETDGPLPHDIPSKLVKNR